MSKNVLGLVVCSLLLGVISHSARPWAVAQEAGKSAAKSEKSESAKKARTGDRLPPNYAKIGLSEEQRQKIYAIQNRYEEQIKALEKQIADLKTQQVSEVEAVLTPEQKKLLQAANEESRRKAAEKKKAGEKKTDGPTEKGDK